MSYKIITCTQISCNFVAIFLWEEINNYKFNTNMHELDSLRSMISKLTIPNLIAQKLIISLVMSEKWFVKV